MPSQTRVISVRLNGRVQEEQDALRIIDELQGRGFNMREIIVDAILRASGLDPAHYRRDEVTIDAIQQIMDTQLSGIEAMLREMASTMAQQAANGTLPVNTSSTASEVDEYANNLLTGLMQRRRK